MIVRQACITFAYSAVLGTIAGLVQCYFGPPLSATTNALTGAYVIATIAILASGTACMLPFWGSLLLAALFGGITVFAAQAIQSPLLVHIALGAILTIATALPGFAKLCSVVWSRRPPKYSVYWD